MNRAIQEVSRIARRIRKIVHVFVVEAREVDEAREWDGGFRAESAMHR
jgi:hypothetical protein